MFCRDLKELGIKIVNYEQKEMIPLTDNENRYYEEQKKKMLYMSKNLLLW